MEDNKILEPEQVTTEAPVEIENKPKVKKPRIKMGVVSGCTKLNVRNHPDKNAVVVATIAEGTEVAVDANRKYDEWYSVCTATGIDGYCMKEFITIQQ